MPHQRKLDADAKAKAATLLSLQANKQMVQAAIVAETGKVVTLRDLTNIASRSKTNASRNDLPTCVETLQSKYSKILTVDVSLTPCYR